MKRMIPFALVFICGCAVGWMINESHTISATEYYSSPTEVICPIDGSGTRIVTLTPFLIIEQKGGVQIRETSLFQGDPQKQAWVIRFSNGGRQYIVYAEPQN